MSVPGDKPGRRGSCREASAPAQPACFLRVGDWLVVTVTRPFLHRHLWGVSGVARRLTGGWGDTWLGTCPAARAWLLSVTPLTPFPASALGGLGVTLLMSKLRVPPARRQAGGTWSRPGARPGARGPALSAEFPARRGSALLPTEPCPRPCLVPKVYGVVPSRAEDPAPASVLLPGQVPGAGA